MMAVSNLCGTRTLKFDDVVGVLLSKEAHRKSSRLAKTSGSALSVDRRGSFGNGDKKKNGRSKFKSVKVHPGRGVWDVGSVVRWGIFRRIASI